MKITGTIMSSTNNWLHKLLQQNEIMNVEKRTVEDLENKEQDICTETIAIFHHFLLTNMQK